MDSELLIEISYLNRTKQVAKEQIDLLKETSEKRKEDILVQKKEMREEAKHSISSNLYSSDNFDQLVALSQLATQASDTINKYEDDMKKIEQLEKFMHRPYFARIDFKFDDEDAVEQVYIGRYSIMEEPSFNRLVYDWRAPISSLFYRYGTGKASYDAPVGTITGEIELKRQYEINDSGLEYYFDADVQILDDFLRKMLTHNASKQMKSIVETIQRDQDLIIRNMASDLMMVQGVAGSGKTSVALHRVAYLMYNGLTRRLASQNIVIISPNTLFEKYISQVLPELGEENVASFLFDELYDMILDRPFQTKNQLYESLLTHKDSTLIKDRLKFKMNTEFITALSQLTLKKDMTVDQLIGLYIQIFYDNVNFDAQRLLYEDATAIVYLFLRCNGYDDYRHIKHIVVDEAQDYYPLHFEILKLMFPNAQFTVLGDINQTIEKHETLSFFDSVDRILGKNNSTLVTMDKSFRCAREILEFSAQFVETKLQSYSRHCEAPQIIRRDHEKDIDALTREIELCIDKDYKSIGILCKSEKASKKLYETLQSKFDINLIQSQSNTELTGTFILPIYLSKGLEFDAAILWDVDELNYHTIEDKQLLYIGCTRALHRLNLFYCGTMSPLL